jgi:hypothetical protein
MDRTQQNKTQSLAHRGRFIAGFVACMGHVTGVVTCAALMLAMGLPEHTFALAFEALRDGFVLGQLKLDGLTLLGLSSLAWGVVYGGIHQMLKHDRRGRRVKVQRVARLSRGTVMTETLIVIPVYILVMLGTMQLSQNMMAGLLTTLSAFEAGRTAAVWIPEAESGRNGVSDDLVNDKVRIAAATVVTPVTPAGFATSCGDADGSESLEKLITGLKAAGHRSEAVSLLSISQGYDRNLNVGRGFDVLPAFFRGIPKLTAAYCATSVDSMAQSQEDGVTMVTTTVSYRHMAVMPVVARIFGSPDTVGDRAGYFTTITRAYKMPMQISPNPRSPLD